MTSGTTLSNSEDFLLILLFEEINIITTDTELIARAITMVRVKRTVIRKVEETIVESLTSISDLFFSLSISRHLSGESVLPSIQP